MILSVVRASKLFGREHVTVLSRVLCRAMKRAMYDMVRAVKG